MDRIFLYWDNSNILISAQDVAEEQEGWGARSRVRIHFSAMIGLVPPAKAHRTGSGSGVVSSARVAWRLEQA